MRRHLLSALAWCAAALVLALSVPRAAMATPYHATDPELAGTAYAVLSSPRRESWTSCAAPRRTGTRAPARSDPSAAAGMDYWFEGMDCTSMDLAKLDTSNVTSMSFTFSSCSSLSSLDVRSFDTSKVTSMSNMFHGCSSLASLDVSHFDTSKVTGMTDMFSYCSSLASIDVSSFDTSKVRSMYEMFNCCESLASLDLSSFDTSKVTDMDSMFYGCNSLDKITFGDKFVVS